MMESTRMAANRTRLLMDWATLKQELKIRRRATVAKRRKHFPEYKRPLCLYNF